MGHNRPLKGKRILSLGTAYVDINAVKFPFTDGLFPEKEIKGGQYELEPGGSALNFARICAALGLSPIFLGKTGTDYLGDVLEKLCRHNNITPAFIRSSTVQTNVGLNLVNADGLSLLAAVGTANDSLTITDVEDKAMEYFPQLDYLYLGGCFGLKNILPAFEDLIKKAKRHDILVCIDHGRIHPQVTPTDIIKMQKLVQLSDIYFPSRDELLTVWEADTIQAAVQKIQKNSTVKVVVKDSVNGVFAFIDGQEFHAPSYAVPTYHTIGAGDSFNAGFIKGLCDKLSIEECLRYGNATAAVKVSQPGLPTSTKIRQIIKSSYDK